MQDAGADGNSGVWQVRDGARAFAARADRTVLAAAEAAGVEWASSCRNGTCRTCLRRLDAGEVTYRLDWPGVLPDEREAGWFLPCVAYARSDLVLADGGDQSLPVT
jgi:ferredoxin